MSPYYVNGMEISLTEDGRRIAQHGRLVGLILEEHLTAHELVEIEDCDQPLCVAYCRVVACSDDTLLRLEIGA